MERKGSISISLGFPLFFYFLSFSLLLTKIFIENQNNFREYCPIYLLWELKLLLIIFTPFQLNLKRHLNFDKNSFKFDFLSLFFSLFSLSLSLIFSLFSLSLLFLIFFLEIPTRRRKMGKTSIRSLSSFSNQLNHSVRQRKYFFPKFPKFRKYFFSSSNQERREKSRKKRKINKEKNQ